jgi:hypothetical protein
LNWLAGGEVLVAILLFVLWWLAGEPLCSINPRSAVGFVFWPSVFILWIIGNLVLIAQGIGAV